MSDDSEKTEEPTDKKLSDSRKKGEVAKSREVNNAVMLIAAGIMLLAIAPSMAQSVTGLAKIFLAQPHTFAIDHAMVINLMQDVLYQLLLILIIPFALFVVLAFLGGIIQHGFLFTAEQMKPKFTKISPISGAKKFVSPQQLMEFAKTLAKLLMIGAVLTLLILPTFDSLSTVIDLPLIDLVTLLWENAMLLLVAAVLIQIIIAVADFTFQKHQHMKKMKMSHQEVKDEHKSVEGDPQVKGRIRALRMERARQRMMAAVPEADVVITNPTHYAVALKYDGESMAAPRLVAKGADLIAQRIRELAAEHQVPMVRNPPLARALHDFVELDQEVPPQHYEAVARVVAYVMRLRAGYQGEYSPS